MFTEEKAVDQSLKNLASGVEDVKAQHLVVELKAFLKELEDLRKK